MPAGRRRGRVIMTAPMPFATAGGHRLEYERIDGPEAAPVLVFLHEGLGSIRQWKDFPQKLCAATGCRGLAYNRYGYGDSDVLEAPRRADFMHVEARETLPELLRALGIERPVLVGHSDGASIALIHAGSGFAVRGVVVEAAHVSIEPSNLEAIRRIGAEAVTSGLVQRLGKYHRDPAKTFFGWHDVWLSEDFRQWNIEAFLAGITVPLMAIQGADDQYGTPAQLEAIARGAGGPCETQLLPDCGHTPHREAEAASLALMARTIAALAAR